MQFTQIIDTTRSEPNHVAYSLSGHYVPTYCVKNFKSALTNIGCANLETEEWHESLGNMNGLVENIFEQNGVFPELNLVDFVGPEHVALINDADQSTPLASDLEYNTTSDTTQAELASTREQIALAKEEVRQAIERTSALEQEVNSMATRIQQLDLLLSTTVEREQIAAYFDQTNGEKRSPTHMVEEPTEDLASDVTTANELMPDTQEDVPQPELDPETTMPVEEVTQPTATNTAAYKKDLLLEAHQLICNEPRPKRRTVSEAFALLFAVQAVANLIPVPKDRYLQDLIARLVFSLQIKVSRAGGKGGPGADRPNFVKLHDALHKAKWTRIEDDECYYYSK